MPDLRAAYRQSEEQTQLLAIGIAAILVVGVLGVVFLSPLTILGTIIGLIFFVLTVTRPLVGLTVLAVYLPFEPFLLKWMPEELYLPARLFSEALVYTVFGVALLRRLLEQRRLPITPINLPFALFVIVLLASSLINLVDPEVALVGMRQLLRFILLFFTVVMLDPDRAYVRKLTAILFAVVIIQSALGIGQAVFGEPLDVFLLPSETRTYGEFTLTEGTVQFWDPGSRVFGTLGRYDRLGTFLAFFLLLAVGFLYEKQIRLERRELWWLFLLGLPALVLTYSRSSWFGFLLGFLFIALAVKRDRRVLYGVGVAGALIVGYLLISGLQVGELIDVPDQPLVERFFEAFSIERWRGEYYGLGRVFWIIETFRSVLPASPLFGWGPGQYGGGAAILFHNTTVYDQLGLPYGVYGSEGYIDNNWLSILGETGIIGFLLFLSMYIILFHYALQVAWRSGDAFVRALALGFAGAMIAVAINAFLATFFEVRSLAVYLWMYAGFIVVLGQREKITV